MLIGALAAVAALAQEDGWQALINRGSAAEVAGDYGAAVQAYREASRVADAFGPGDLRRMYAFNAQGMMYDALGRLADAEMAYQQALAVLDRSDGGPSLNRSVLLANIANVCLESGQLARAEKLLREAIAIHKALPAPSEVRLAIARNSLAEVLTGNGNYGEAARLIESSVPVLEKHAEAATELGSALNNLGAVRLYQRRAVEAQAAIERSLATLEGARGPSHPILLRTLHNLAVAQERNGQLAAAGRTWRRTVDLAATALGIEHPLYGQILGSYAAWLRASGDKAAGKALAARSAEILRDHQRRNGVGAVVDVNALRQGSK